MDFGIQSMEIYFPRTFVAQSAMETEDGRAGRITVGLGQTKMAVCTNVEDINSICLSVTNNLFQKHNIDPQSIGFLEVGTESIIDKSKSTKSVLMKLFESCGNTDIQGVDVKNACFGGTAALFSALDWLESSNCDGRLALVVAGDIAVYDEGPARCTGGAGAIAILLGPNASLVFDKGVRSHYMSHEWDFYKPKLNSEYPYFDGKTSIQCYQTALDKCFELYKRKCEKNGLFAEEMLTFKESVYFCFHSPYAKLVQKSFARLVFNDLKNNKTLENLSGDQFDIIKSFLYKSDDDINNNKDLEVALIKFCKDLLTNKVEPTLHMARNIGNMYTASLYSCLASLLIKLPLDKLCGSRVVLFSYGSGCASCMFSLTVTKNKYKLLDVISHLQLASERLETRVEITPLEFKHILDERQNLINKCAVKLSENQHYLFPGTYFLTDIDDKYRRHYDIHPLLNNGDL